MLFGAVLHHVGVISSPVSFCGYKLFTNHLNPLKTTFPKRPETNPCQPLSNKQRGKQAMSVFIRIVILAACAYAGSAVAGIQFQTLPDPYQMAQK